MMAYQSPGFIATILHNNRPVREFTETNERTCIVPFGSEYKVRLKNKTDKRCKVKVFIDGMDTNSDGSSFVLAAQQSLDLERFVDDLKSGKKFKFISVEEGTKTGEIQDPTSSENGLIRVEFHPESLTISGGYVNIWQNYPPYYAYKYVVTSTNNTTSTNTITDINDIFVNTSTGTHPGANGGFDLIGSDFNKTKGATVQGGTSNQAFISVSDFVTDAPVVITMRMRGSKSETNDLAAEVSKQNEQYKKLQQEFEELKKEKREKSQGFEVILKNNLIMIKFNGQDFISSNEAVIDLSDEGLSIKGKGMDIKTKEYRLIAG
jgi:hypothetical protein